MKKPARKLRHCMLCLIAAPPTLMATGQGYVRMEAPWA